MRFVTHLESALDGTHYDANRLQTMHEGRPLWVRYDLDAVAAAWGKNPLSQRPGGMWRYRDLLPIGDEIQPVSLNEYFSPIVECPRLARDLGLRHLLIKDESQLPLCSFKCRGLSLAVTMAQHFGQRRLAMASNGNAAAALAAYAARAGVEAVVVMPNDVNQGSIFECWVHGARTFLANGLIDQCGKLVRAGHDAGHWFDVSTLKEPYRLEGKKTMGLEIAEQMEWQLPDVIIYSTGGGTALIGMWKAFKELEAMGWLRSATLPRMIAAQSNGCQPIVTAFDKGERFATRHENAATRAYGIRVPQAIGDFMILDAVRESGGTAIAIEERCLLDYQRRASSAEGLSFGLETAASVAAVEQLLSKKLISADERIMIVNTAGASKYWTTLPQPLPSLDLAAAVDPASLLANREKAKSN